MCREWYIELYAKHTLICEKKSDFLGNHFPGSMTDYISNGKFHWTSTTFLVSIWIWIFHSSVFAAVPLNVELPIPVTSNYSVITTLTPNQAKKKSLLYSGIPFVALGIGLLAVIIIIAILLRRKKVFQSPVRPVSKSGTGEVLLQNSTFLPPALTVTSPEGLDQSSCESLENEMYENQYYNLQPIYDAPISDSATETENYSPLTCHSFLTEGPESYASLNLYLAPVDCPDRSSSYEVSDDYCYPESDDYDLPEEALGQTLSNVHAEESHGQVGEVDQHYRVPAKLPRPSSLNDGLPVSDAGDYLFLVDGAQGEVIYDSVESS